MLYKPQPEILHYLGARGCAFKLSFVTIRYQLRHRYCGSLLSPYMMQHYGCIVLSSIMPFVSPTGLFFLKYIVFGRQKASGFRSFVCKLDSVGQAWISLVTHWSHHLFFLSWPMTSWVQIFWVICRQIIQNLFFSFVCSLFTAACKWEP